MADPMKLHIEHFRDNLEDITTQINKRGWAKYVLAMDCCSDSRTTSSVVFRMPRYLVHEIRAENRAYLDADHDDPVTPEEGEMSCLM